MKDKIVQIIHKIQIYFTHTIPSFFKGFISDIRNKHLTNRVISVFSISLTVVLAVTIVALLCETANKSDNTTRNELSSSTEEIENTPLTTETAEAIATVSEINKNYDKDAVKIDEVKYESLVAKESQDAGQEYIDKTLFIGDSNTVRMMNYGFTTLENTFAVTGMGIQSVDTLQCIELEGYSSPLTIPEAVKLFQPKRIIITFGTNNASGMDTKTFINKYKSAISSIQKSYKYADIIINSVPPFHKVNSYPKLSMAVVDEYNVALADMSHELGLTFLDTASVLKDENTGFAKDEYTVNDGIHITKAGFEAMFKYIRTHSHITEDTRPKPLDTIPKQKGTVYVISGDGKISHDPKAFGDMSDKNSKTNNSILATISSSKSSTTTSIFTMTTSSSTEKIHYHSWANSEITLAPTYDNDGKRTYYCECGAKKEEVIRKLDKPAASSTVEKVVAPSATTSSSASQTSSSALVDEVAPVPPVNNESTSAIVTPANDADSVADPAAGQDQGAAGNPPQDSQAETPVSEPAAENGNSNGESNDGEDAPAE